MNHTGIWARSVESRFIDKVSVALVLTAIAVSAEDPATPNHANRVALARNLLNSPRTYAANFALAVAAHATVQAEPTDANITAAVAAQWSAFAGVA